MNNFWFHFLNGWGSLGEQNSQKELNGLWNRFQDELIYTSKTQHQNCFQGW